jgi:hypothetical protein
MLNAAEAAIDALAEDDTARERTRAMLYAPPGGAGGERRRARPPGAGMDMASAQALAAQVAAEDARMTRGVTS